VKRTCFADDPCPIARSLDTIGDWWSLLIVREAFAGKTRFGEFQESLGVARNILTDRLKKLVLEGVLELVPAADGSAYREYRLTEKGRGLILVLTALSRWGGDCAEWKLVDGRTEQPVGLELRTKDGRKVGVKDVKLVLAGRASRSH